MCKRELGIESLPAMSCLAGKEIPITVDGQPLNDINYSQLQQGEGCDNPQWLQSGCHNYDLIQKIDVGNPDVEAILNCRQKYFTNPNDENARKTALSQAPASEKVAAYQNLAEFNDLGLILRNVKTGKSCFFTIFGRHFNGAWLPPPDMTRLPPKEDVRARLETKPPADYPEDSWYRDARTTYLTPRSTANGGCVGCHDLGAFKTSPFVDQVGIVPRNKSKQLPYLLVGNVFQEAFRSRRMIDVTTEPVEGSAQVCTSCHRMASGGASCNQFLDWVTGHDPSPRSASAKTFPKAAWMPMGHTISSAEQYEARYGKHIARMKCCCQKPNAKGCLTREYGPTPRELGTVAPGRMLPDFEPAAEDAPESCL
jgi:hypothetical protein